MKGICQTKFIYCKLSWPKVVKIIKITWNRQNSNKLYLDKWSVIGQNSNSTVNYYARLHKPQIQLHARWVTWGGLQWLYTVKSVSRWQQVGLYIDKNLAIWCVLKYRVYCSIYWNILHNCKQGNILSFFYYYSLY